MSIDEILLASAEPNCSLSADSLGDHWILIRANDEFGGPDRVAITTSSFTVGRSDEQTLTLASPSVSRKHARISEEDGRLLLTDLGSTNGTFVNGKPITGEQELAHGDLVHFGVCSYTVNRVEPAKGDQRKGALESKFQALKERRDDPRCEIIAPELIELLVRKPTTEGEVVGRLTTLSRRAITFTVTNLLVAGDRLAIEFRHNDQPFPEQLTATVTWVRPLGDQQWDIGCRVDDGDIDTICNKLGAAGIINRRQRSERTPIDISAQAYFELNVTPHPVQLRNYSFGGFCVMSSSERQPTIGSKLRVVLDDEHTVFAQIRWTKPCPDGYLLGCEFFGPSRTKGSQVIREVL